MMYRRHRYRKRLQRELYGRQSSSLLRNALVVFVALCVVYGGYRLWQYWSINSGLRRQPVVLAAEKRGIVQVSLNGEELRNATDGTKLYAGDRIVVGSESIGILTFFDGSTMRLSEGADIRINESVIGKENATIDITFDNGQGWMVTPAQTTVTGSVLRTITTPRLAYSIPNRSEVLFTPTVLNVFSAHREGVGVEALQNSNFIYVGEGQRFSVAETAIDQDLYSYRTALSFDVLDNPFLIESRETFEENNSLSFLKPTETVVDAPVETLTVLTPNSGDTVSSTTVLIQGSFGNDVSSIRINGNKIQADLLKKTFSQEISIAQNGAFDIHIEAVNSNGEVIAEETRTITRKVSSLSTPTVIIPVQDGKTYTTTDTEIEIRGTVARGTNSVIVNNYTLQRFQAGNEEWSYIASLELENLEYGENTFDIFAVDFDGELSKPATITIIIEKTEAAILDTQPTQQNDPLLPNSISIISPAAGNSHQTSETELLIEGTTSTSTYTMWVNDYQLQRYEPGSTNWAYLASAKLGTLKRDSNIYTIIARDESGAIIDKFVYIIVLDLRNEE